MLTRFCFFAENTTIFLNKLFFWVKLFVNWIEELEILINFYKVCPAHAPKKQFVKWTEIHYANVELWII